MTQGSIDAISKPHDGAVKVPESSQVGACSCTVVVDRGQNWLRGFESIPLPFIGGGIAYATEYEPRIAE